MKTNSLVGSLLLIILAGGCATPVAKEREIDKKVDQEVVVGFTGEAANIGQEAIEESANLTEEQKNKIRALIKKTQAEVQEIKIETNKLKATLIKSFSDGTYKAEDIRILKKRLTKLEERKMDTMFSNLDEVQKILGYKPKSRDIEHELRNLYREM